MAEWLMHKIANLDPSGCVGSNPALSVQAIENGLFLEEFEGA